MTPALQQAADRIRAARTTRTVCEPLGDLIPSGDLVAAYTVQDANTDRWLEEGRRLVGRKIGLTSHAVQKQLGVDQPDYGMLFADMAYADSEPIDLTTMLQPRAEAEVAFVLERDLDRDGLTIVDVINAVAYALPAIEVVDSAIRDWKISLVDTVADNASSGTYVLGTTPRKLSAFDHRLCGMVMERRGEVISTGVGAACLGNPLTSMLWLAKKMLEVGRPLHAGDVVLSGALGPMVPVVAGDVVEARISGLGEARAEFRVSRP